MRTVVRLREEEELWFLLSALDTLIFVMTGGVLKEPNEVARTIQEFSALRRAIRRGECRGMI